MPNTPDTNQLRLELLSLVTSKSTIEYKQLADRLGFRPPNTILKTTQLLEACQEDDALLNQPQLAALVVQKNGMPYPRPGFFQKLAELGVYQGPDRGAQAQMWHQNELERVFNFYQAD